VVKLDSVRPSGAGRLRRHCTSAARPRANRAPSRCPAPRAPRSGLPGSTTRQRACARERRTGGRRRGGI